MKSMTAEQRNHMLLCDPVSRVIPKLAVPTIISMLITNIYNMADTFFVSQSCRNVYRWIRCFFS